MMNCKTNIIIIYFKRKRPISSDVVSSCFGFPRKYQIPAVIPPRMDDENGVSSTGCMEHIA